MRAESGYFIKGRAGLEVIRSAQDTEVGIRAITCQNQQLSLEREKGKIIFR
jgi:hypothetical protein